MIDEEENLTDIGSPGRFIGNPKKFKYSQQEELKCAVTDLNLTGQQVLEGRSQHPFEAAAISFVEQFTEQSGYSFHVVGAPCRAPEDAVDPDAAA
jgi:hypothetical protein